MWAGSVERLALVAACAALLSRLAHGGDLAITVTRVLGPVNGTFSFPWMPLGDGILLGVNSGGRISVLQLAGHPPVIRPLAVPGSLSRSLVGYRGPHVFLGVGRTDGSRALYAFDLATRRAEFLLAGEVIEAAAVESGFFFTRLDPSATPGAPRVQLYRTDGTAAGTRLVHANVVGAPYGPAGGAVPPLLWPGAHLVPVGRNVLFWSRLPDDSGDGLYRAQGSRIERVGEFPHSDLLFPFGGRASFLQSRSGETELWVTDGSKDGTRPVHRQSERIVWASCGGQLLFFPGNEAWATDGTTAGTRLLSTLDGWVWPYAFAEAGRTCSFVAGFRSAALWATDLSPGGTVPVGPFEVPPAGGAPLAAGARGRIFYASGAELWVTDGRAAGTRPVTGALPAPISHVMAAASRIFFTVPDPPARANSLWVADLPPGLAIEDGRAEERVAGDSAMTFKVRLSRQSPEEVLVSYETEADTADAGADFVPAKGTLRFARGERVKLIRVSVVSDARTEGEERFRLRLTAPVGAEIDRGLATGTIRDPRAGLPDLRP